MPAKPKLKVISPYLCPYWRFDSVDGSVAIYVPSDKGKSSMTMERANFLLDRAKQNLLKD